MAGHRAPSPNNRMSLKEVTKTVVLLSVCAVVASIGIGMSLVIAVAVVQAIMGE